MEMPVVSVSKNFEAVSIDAGLLLCEQSCARAYRVVNALRGNSINYLFIAHNGNLREKEAVQWFIRETRLCSADAANVERGTEEPNLVLDMVLDGNKKKTIARKIDAGKKVLHLGLRRNRFTSVFTPPRGVVCHEFHKLVLGTGCPYDCAYCYLQLTFRVAPYPRQYLNLEKLWKEFETLSAGTSRRILLNTGELADSLALDPLSGVVAEVISEISRYKNLELLLCTKSSNIDSLPSLSSGRVILSASISTPQNAEVFEHGAAHPYDRIDALRRAQLKGYRIRCRIDPIICADTGWEKQYEDLIFYLFDQVDVEMITLGQLRFYPALLRIIEERHPKAREYFSSLAVASTLESRQRASNEHRIAVYNKIIGMIKAGRGHLDVPVALCKEDPRVIKETQIKASRCNCLD